MQTSAYTRHWSHDPEHNNHQELIGIERVYTDGLLWGAATFKNSFYQRSYYGYLGKVWENPQYPVYAKL
ncbi:sn-glycerol-3-phosphate transporter, partial [Acinetobacter baumannii]